MDRIESYNRNGYVVDVFWSAICFFSPEKSNIDGSYRHVNTYSEGHPPWGHLYHCHHRFDAALHNRRQWKRARGEAEPKVNWECHYAVMVNSNCEKEWWYFTFTFMVLDFWRKPQCLLDSWDATRLHPEMANLLIYVGSWTLILIFVPWYFMSLTYSTLTSLGSRKWEKMQQLLRCKTIKILKLNYTSCTYSTYTRFSTDAESYYELQAVVLTHRF